MFNIFVIARNIFIIVIWAILKTILNTIFPIFRAIVLGEHTSK